MVSRTFATCGLTAHSTLIQKGVAVVYTTACIKLVTTLVAHAGCSLDEIGRYCGNVVDPLITPQWQANVTTATTACAGTDCTSSPCQAAINNVS